MRITLNQKQINALEIAIEKLNSGYVTKEIETASKILLDMVNVAKFRKPKHVIKLGYKVVIIQHPLDGSTAIEHDGVRSAARYVNGEHSAISECINGNRHKAYDSTWERKIISLGA